MPTFGFLNCVSAGVSAQCASKITLFASPLLAGLFTCSCHVQVAEAQEAAQEAKELVQEQTAVANAVRRQAEESRSEAGPLLRQAEQNEQQVRAWPHQCCTVAFLTLHVAIECAASYACLQCHEASGLEYWHHSLSRAGPSSDASHSHHDKWSWSSDRRT